MDSQAARDKCLSEWYELMKMYHIPKNQGSLCKSVLIHQAKLAARGVATRLIEEFERLSSMPETAAAEPPAKRPTTNDDDFVDILKD